MSKSLLAAMCLLSMGGITYSCSDDYDLDETMPSYLGGSIYDELNARGNFKTVVKLIDDLGYKEVLAKTGSKTLFVANDDAYAKFFASKVWKDGNGNPITSYEQLSIAQKRSLLNGSMLNNAYVLEMLSNTEGGGKNLCLRQISAATAVDSIAFWPKESLPVNLNEGYTNASGEIIADKRFWDRYNVNNPESQGLYMAVDKTSPMLTHFLEGYMKDKNIKRSDIAFILNDQNGWSDDAENRSYMYGSKIIEQDVTCLNGYFHVLDSVLVTPANMAEVIRTNGSTNYFSKMLERYSAPYYDYNLTQQYKALYPNLPTDSIFQKRYLASRSQSGSGTMTGPDGKSLGDFPFLTYDPGWNEYAPSNTIAKEQDMGAMFVPNDAAMEEYFLRGAGTVLMDRFATKENTKENLEHNLYQIPLDLLEALISNLMKDSFAETVPSKYLTIKNDAQDQMFPASNPDYATEAKYRDCFDKCLLANNGVVYVMNRVISPADYAAVIAPVLRSANTQVMKAVLQADDKFIEGSSYNNAPLKKYYSTYLKAMQSRFTFFVPTDDGLGTYGYVDPVSIARGKGASNGYKYWRFTYKDATNALIPVRAEAFRYDMEKGQQESDKKQTVGGSAANLSEPAQSLAQGAGKAKASLLVDMVDQHIIVHDNDDVEGINSSRNYFTSRGGAPVVVLGKGIQNPTGDEKPNLGMLVNGGFQLQLKKDEFTENDHDCKVIDGYNMTSEKNGYGNGMTYLLDRPMQPTTNSVFGIMNGSDNYSEFFKLCQFSLSADELELMGQRDSTWTTENNSEWKAEQNKYRIFTATDVNPAEGEQLIRFFNNFRYTIYVPTNEALQKAYANGLPQPDEIHQFIIDNTVGANEEEGTLGTMPVDAQKKALAMATMLVNFVKYHFQDESIYLDNVTEENQFQTSCIDNETNTYIAMTVNQTDGAIQVTDKGKNKVNVIAPYNIFARDANYNNTISSATAFKVTSFAVLHQIDGVLNFKPLVNGRYDNDWKSAKKAEAFVKKYELRK